MYYIYEKSLPRSYDLCSGNDEAKHYGTRAHDCSTTPLYEYLIPHPYCTVHYTNNYEI